MIFLAGAYCTFGQEKVSELKDKRITLKMEKQPLGVIFKHLIVKYDVAIGFEESTLDRDHNDYDFDTNLPILKENWVSTDGETQVSITTERIFEVKQHWFTVNFQNERLEDVLNQIVGQMKNYEWEINDDVVNIFPVKGRDERYKKLLELNIKNFKVEKPALIFVIRNNIIDLPEVKGFLDESKIFYSTNRSGIFDHLKRKLPQEINFSNITFRNLLNSITKIKRGGWILKQNDFLGTKEKEYIDIDI